MTVSTIYEPDQYNGNGVTTLFSVTNQFYEDTDIIVTSTVIATNVNTVLVLNTDYTVAGGDGSTGSVTALVAPANGVRITIEVQIPYLQESDFLDGNTVLAETVEDTFDRGVIQVQQVLDQSGRTAKFPATYIAGLDPVLPVPEDGLVIGWDGTDGTMANISLSSFQGVLSVTFTGLASGDYLTYNGSVWVNQTGAALATAIGAATLTGSQTLTNKTLTSPIIGGNPSGVIPQTCDGRLTLTTGLPVTTTDVTAAGTVYFTPYKGNRIALYSGTSWLLFTFTELSISLASGFTIDKNYDVFAYNNAGTVALETVVWTNDTTRATALAYQDGVLCKSGTLTRRYIGTFRTTTGTATEDSLAKRFVWNNQNRVLRPMQVVDATASWNYTTLTWRQARATATNQLDYVCGVAEDMVTAECTATAANSSASVYAGTAIGVDSTSSPSGIHPRLGMPSNGQNHSGSAHYRGIPGVGRHYLAWLEIAQATGTCTFIGTSAEIVNGITGSVSA